MASVATGRTCRQGKLRSPASRSSAWIFQVLPKHTDHEAGSGRPVARESMRCACTRPNTDITAASISTPEVSSSTSSTTREPPSSNGISPRRLPPSGPTATASSSAASAGWRARAPQPAGQAVGHSKDDDLHRAVENPAAFTTGKVLAASGQGSPIHDVVGHRNVAPPLAAHSVLAAERIHACRVSGIFEGGFRFPFPHRSMR